VRVDCLFTISGNHAWLSGVYPIHVVRKATSHYLDGFQFMPRFKKMYKDPRTGRKRRMWDGKHHFFDRGTGRLPAGLVPAAIDALREYEAAARIMISDAREQEEFEVGNHGFELHGIEFGKGKYDFQQEAAEILVREKRGILKVATNGGKTEIAAAVTQHLGVPTLFLVERLELLYQTRERFALRLGIPEEEIGLIGDQKFAVGEWITVATPKSFKARLAEKAIQDALTWWKLVWADECHRVASDTFYAIMDRLPAYYRFGMSASPLKREDGHDMRLVAQTGPVLYDVPSKLLVARGISVLPYVEMLEIKEPDLSKEPGNFASINRLGITENERFNKLVVTSAAEHVRAGKQVVILVELKKHGKLLSKMLKAKKVEHQYLDGSMDMDTVRRPAVQALRTGELRCVVSLPILDEGVDIPGIDVLILAGGGKAQIRLLQRVGRGLRSSEGKDRLLIIDFANYTHPWLLKHSLQRLKTYKAEDCFMISAG
jgi:superfamily II DNA or RNA helicase